MEKIIDGRIISKELRRNLGKEILKIEEELSKRPKLKVVVVGDNSSAISYIKGVISMSKLTRIDVELEEYPIETTEEQFLDNVELLNKDNSVNGVLIMTPLPDHISVLKVFNRLDPVKDVDGLTPFNVGNFFKYEECHMAATPKGVDNIIEYLGLDIKGMNVCVIGASIVVGRPMAEHLLRRDATVSICHKETRDLTMYTKQADIVVSCAGVPNLVTADMVKDDVIILDVGVNFVDGKMCGDCDFDGILEKARYITPVPGGVGPMTIAQIYTQTFNAFKKMNNL